jgi:hypothetical protein
MHSRSVRTIGVLEFSGGVELVSEQAPLSRDQSRTGFPVAKSNDQGVTCATAEAERYSALSCGCLRCQSVTC